MKATYLDLFGKKHVLENLNVTVGYDEYFYEDEFYHGENVKIDIMPHRSYNFLKELDLNWEYLTSEYEEGDYYYEDWKEEIEKFKKINEEYFVFGLDFFEHSMISFSLVEKRMDIGYYEFDRTRNIGYIAVKKEENLSYSQAMKIAEETIEDYNSYCNGWISEFRIEDNNGDFVDGCTGFYRDEDARRECIDSIAWYLKNNKIEYKTIELED